jgi:RNA polymerase sigma factor (sigma-70 family)
MSGKKAGEGVTDTYTSFNTGDTMHTDINELILLSQSGDMAAREKVFEENKLIIWHVLKRTSYDPKDTTDLYQTGAAAMIKAINTFDIRQNVKFSTFAFMCVQRTIFNKTKQSFKHRDNISIYEPTSQEDSSGSSQYLADTLAARDTGIDTDTRIDLQNAVNALGSLHKRVIKLLFTDDKTQAEAAEILEISQTHVSRIKRAALKTLRETMAYA